MEWARPRTKTDYILLLTTLIPQGYTATYKLLAELAGTSPRAVGIAMKRNRDLIVVPCHRVVATKGLGGYSKGPHFKRKLLELEGALHAGAPRRLTSPDEFWKTLEEKGETVALIDP